VDKIKLFKKFSNIYALFVFLGIVILGVLRGTETITGGTGQIAIKLLLLVASVCSLYAVAKYKYFIPFDVLLTESRPKFFMSLLVCIFMVVIVALSLMGF
jgi:hypothetical protein